ncbi:MAG TPA: condensation domain-containing protein, partial [Acetobacteraceae bacterium]
PEPEVASGRGGQRAPRTPREELLCSLFAEVLGRDRVGVEDNFFELGGDSIVSIQLVSRARRAGLSITPRAVFQHQTVEALAAVAGVAAEAASALAEADLAKLAVGGLPATPIMRWLKERGGPLERFSQGMLLSVPAGVREEHLAAAFSALLDHHDALRLRLAAAPENAAGGAAGEWSVEIAPCGAVAGSACLRRVEADGLDEAELRGLIATEADAAEGRLDPAAGVMVQAVWFDAGAARPGRLWLSIHHLAVDGVSWRILVPDLASAWQAIAAGRAVSLPPRGTPFRRWAQHLAARAQDAGVTKELSFWSGELSKPSLLLVEDKLDAGRDTAGTAGHLTLTLPSAVTAALLTRVPSAFHGGIDDVLLTGLALAVADWCRRHAAASAAGRGADVGRGANHGAHHGANHGAKNHGATHAASHAVLLDLEGHGREEGLGREEALGRADAVADVDLTRTVGWFTSLYPVRLDPGLLDLEDALSGGAALGRALKTIKEQLRAVPGKGLGYGLLRYLNDATARELSGLAVPQLGFNYLGRFAAGGEGAMWAPAIMDKGKGKAGDAGHGGSDAAMLLAHPIEINALTLDGADGPQLAANWTWASALLDEAAIR